MKNCCQEKTKKKRLKVEVLGEPPDPRSPQDATDLQKLTGKKIQNYNNFETLCCLMRWNLQSLEEEGGEDPWIFLLLLFSSVPHKSVARILPLVFHESQTTWCLVSTSYGPRQKPGLLEDCFVCLSSGASNGSVRAGTRLPPGAPHAAPAPLPAQTHVFTEKPPDRLGNEVLASCAKFPISSEFDCLLQSDASFPQAPRPPFQLTCSRDAPEIMDHLHRWGQVSHVHDRWSKGTKGE